MEYFYFLYALLLFYLIHLFNEIRKSLKLSSYIILYKASEHDDKSFTVATLSTIFKNSAAPLFAIVSIAIKFAAFKSSFERKLSYADYSINFQSIDWYNLIIGSDNNLINITDINLLDLLGQELMDFRIHSAIFILSALAVQAKIFDKSNVVIFEEGILHSSTLYSWEQIHSIDIVDDEETIINLSNPSLPRKDFLNFEIEIDKNPSRYNFFKNAAKVIPSDALDTIDTIYEKLEFKIPDSKFLDFKCAIRMVNIKSNLL